MAENVKKTKPIAFKAETQQLLDILINSIYSDKDVFLRELVSNASDAITKLNFVMLTDHDVLDADAAPEIRVKVDKDAKTLTVSDNGLGMTADEMKDYLGTIAHSGAKALLESAGKDQAKSINDLIGQFGVGFYAAFMVADSIDVISRSYKKDEPAALWHSDGAGTFTVGPAEREHRGTDIVIKLKEDAAEYADDFKIREIIRKHSNYIPYPIYLNEETEQINAANVIWRSSASELKDEDYKTFYQNFTMDFNEPLKRLHLSIDAPVQMYALLFVPATAERNMFSLRKEDGLQLYARKVLIQDYCTDLLPRYYRFIQGVIDSEDIPLNVSRETMQANRVIVILKKILTGKVTDMLKKWGTDDPEGYAKFWNSFGDFICEGIITEQDAKDPLTPLLRFHTMNHGTEWRSLSDYFQEMKPEQKKIYYVLGDNLETLRNSPHTEKLRKDGIDVLLLDKVYDPFVMTALQKYQDCEIVNAASEGDKKEEEKPAEDEDKENKESDKKEETPENKVLTDLFAASLGDLVSAVRTTDRLVSSPARLVESEGAIPQEYQRIYKAMQQDYTAPKKVLELNPEHPLIQKVSGCQDEELRNQIIAQIYDDAMIMDGEAPDQVAMLERLQNLMLKLLK
ncbi:MAG: molecular chaperone HtpG [Anaerolineaceae bacterium]|nr:molecular chaperone HtpG [Anaerolineaceae bacterium]